MRRTGLSILVRTLPASSRHSWSSVVRRSAVRTGVCSHALSSTSRAASMGSPQRTNGAAAPFKVLVVGGAYSGLTAALNLSDLCLGKPSRAAVRYQDKSALEPGAPIDVDITVVDERDGFLHLIGAPLAFADKAYADKIWVPYADIAALQAAPNIRMVQGSVTAVDMAHKTATIRPAPSAAATATEIPYDILIVAAGLRRAAPVAPQATDKAAFLAEVAPYVDTAAAATKPDNGVLIVGGGAVGIEMAAEMRLALPRTHVTLAHSRGRLLSSEPLPDRLATTTLDRLRDHCGVNVLLDHRLHTTRDVGAAKEIVFANGHTMRASTVIVAISKSTPSTSFLPAAALNGDGYVKIQPTLFFPDSVPNADTALAGGDLVQWSGIKRCGAAIHMGGYMAYNAHQRLQQMAVGTSPVYRILEPIPPVIAIALGTDAVACHADGEVETGPAIVERFFEDDVGFAMCCDMVGLGVTEDTKA